MPQETAHFLYTSPLREGHQCEKMKKKKKECKKGEGCCLATAMSPQRCLSLTWREIQDLTSSVFAVDRPTITVVSSPCRYTSLLTFSVQQFVFILSHVMTYYQEQGGYGLLGSDSSICDEDAKLCVVWYWNCVDLCRSVSVLYNLFLCLRRRISFKGAVSEAEVRDSSVEMLQSYLTSIIESIVGSVDQCPPVMRVAFKQLHKRVEEQFTEPENEVSRAKYTEKKIWDWISLKHVSVFGGRVIITTAIVMKEKVPHSWIFLSNLPSFLQDVKYLAISGFFFLRFFAPAILTPKLFQLRDQHADTRTSRTLLLLAKVCFQTQAHTQTLPWIIYSCPVITLKCIKNKQLIDERLGCKVTSCLLAEEKWIFRY